MTVGAIPQSSCFATLTLIIQLSYSSWHPSEIFSEPLLDCFGCSIFFVFNCAVSYFLSVLPLADPLVLLNTLKLKHVRLTG